MEPDYIFRSYKEYLPEKYQAIFNEYWLNREHSMIELVQFLKMTYENTTADKSNQANVAEAMIACCEFFFNGEYGGYDEPGNDEEEKYLSRYGEGIYKIIKTLHALVSVAEGKQSENEMRDVDQIWNYLGWNITDQLKILS